MVSALHHAGPPGCCQAPPSPLAPTLPPPPHEQLLTVAGAGAGPWSCHHPSPSHCCAPLFSLVSSSPCPHSRCSLVLPLLIIPALSLLSGHCCHCSPSSFSSPMSLLAAVGAGAGCRVAFVVPLSPPSRCCAPSLSPAPPHSKALYLKKC